MKISAAAFAKECGISRQMLYKYIADDKVVQEGRGIDTSIQKNSRFRAAMVRKQLKEGKKSETEIHRDGDRIVVTKVIQKSRNGHKKEEPKEKSAPRKKVPSSKKKKASTESVPLESLAEDPPKSDRKVMKASDVFDMPDEPGTPPMTRKEQIALRLDEVKLAKVLEKIVATDLIFEIVQTLPKELATRHHAHIRDIHADMSARFKMKAEDRREANTRAVERTNRDSEEAIEAAKTHILALIKDYAEKRGL